MPSLKDAFFAALFWEMIMRNAILLLELAQDYFPENLLQSSPGKFLSNASYFDCMQNSLHQIWKKEKPYLF